MTEGNGDGDELEPQPAPKRTWWFQRPTLRTLKARAEIRAVELRESSDRRDNDESRLPPTESVHLGGLVLTEAFTPSTASGLNRAVKNLLVKPESRDKLLDSIARSRLGGPGGFQNFHVFRPGVGLVDSESYRDPGLPEVVDAVWLQFNCTVPSLTMVVATFTLSEQAGDLSSLMRQDYQSKIDRLRIRVFGRAAWLRERIPWARPRRHGPTYSISMAAQEKARTCADAIHRHQETCERWFYDRFPGRFSQADADDRPIARLLFTTEQAPFTNGAKWFQPVALERSFDLWRSTDKSFPGWFLSFGHWPLHEGRHTITFAARRKDAGKDRLGDQDRETNWYLTQMFGGFQAPLVARYAMVALLAVYSDELGRLRDKAGIKRRPQRTVREAKALDGYLIGDGLDAATVTSDIHALTKDIARFRWEVPEYAEVLENDRSSKVSPAVTTDNLLTRAKRLRDRIMGVKVYKKDDQDSKPKAHNFTIILREGLSDQATRLADDTAAATGNIQASAELRQAMANTRLQRVILFLTVVAIAVALISLMVAIG